MYVVIYATTFPPLCTADGLICNAPYSYTDTDFPVTEGTHSCSVLHDKPTYYNM